MTVIFQDFGMLRHKLFIFSLLALIALLITTNVFAARGIAKVTIVKGKVLEKIKKSSG
jgi:hypothetical protein